MTIRITVSDVVSPSYFVAVAAAELGFFSKEGLDAELIWPPADASKALRNGDIDLYGASPYAGLMAFANWRGGKVLCALSRGAYWVLAIRADLGIKRGDLTGLKGLRILSSPAPGLALKHLLNIEGIGNYVEIVPPPWPPSSSANLARQGVRAIQEGIADGFWGNAMRAEYALRMHVATVVADIRRGDGPQDAFYFTFPALLASEKFIKQRPNAAASVVRAIVNTQRALKHNPDLATVAAKRFFPSEEAEIISELISRDAPFYDASVSKDAIARTVRFAQDVGLITAGVRYEDVVVGGLQSLWVT